MTKGQKIIVSLLVVVAVGLVLNISREVGGQVSPPPPEEVQTSSERTAQAVRDRREQRRRAGEPPKRQVPLPGLVEADGRRASERAEHRRQQELVDQLTNALGGSATPSNDLMVKLAADVILLRHELEEHDIHMEAQWLILSEDLDEYHWKVAARFKVLLKNQEAILMALGAKSPFAPIGRGVVGIHPGHPDFVVDDAERERMAKLFDELEAAEKKKETQDD